MNYEQFKADIIGRSGANRISDEAISIQYKDLNGILDDLDILFNPYRREGIRCIALIVDNSVAHVAIILYLLKARINFTLISSHAAAGDKIPFFCDFILTTTGGQSTVRDIAASVRLTGNPDYERDKSALRRNSGSVFLLSSGTSGPAKYIHFTQLNLLNNARNCITRFAIDHRSGILIPVPINHMYGMGVGLLPALLSGAAICLIDKTNIVKLLDRISAFKPDITLLTPTVIKMILLLRQKIDGRGIYITAGEKLPAKTHQDFDDRYGRLFNLYGCTELGAIAVSEGDATGILRPLKRVKVKISKEDNGQILCKHNAGFTSYRDRHGRRIPAEEIGWQWYKTKDLGTDMGSPGFTVIGRMDNCINRHGFLISLDEIGAFLENLFTEINQAIVFEGREEGLSTKLVAVCELVRGRTLDAKLVKSICRDKTESCRVPDEFFFMEEMPRLNNGKPDRTLLLNQYS